MSTSAETETPDADSCEAEALLDAMHAHAEEVCAGWLTGMEFYLWSAVCRDGRYPANIKPGRVRLLRNLSEMAGGWWMHTPTERKFLPTQEWVKTYLSKGPLDSV